MESKASTTASASASGPVRACLDALASPLLAALLALPPGGLPRLVPVPIADRIAQRQHGIDVVPTEAASRPLLTVLRRPPYWHFPRCPSQWASLLADRWGTACAPRARANRPVSPGLLDWDSARPTKPGA